VTQGASIDGVLVQWGERLFYPPSRIVKAAATPRLGTLARRQAAVIRRRIEATVARRSVQVMVKVTGGGRGMAAIAARFRYISKNGRLDIEDDRGVVREGKEALHDLVEQWRHGGSLSTRWAIGARPSTSCCPCRMAPIRRSSGKRPASSPRLNCRATAT
jgi:hypothetical protein